MTLPSLTLLAAVALLPAAHPVAPHGYSLEPLTFNDQIADCEYMFYPAASADAPEPKILQIPVHEKPVGVIRTHGARQELLIDRPTWEALSSYQPGPHRIELKGSGLSVVVTFTLDDHCDTALGEEGVQSCMDSLEGTMLIDTPDGTEQVYVRGAAGC